MAKRLEIAEALSTRTVNEMSEKEKMIQEQVKLIEEKEKEGSSDALRAKDKEIMVAAEKLEEEVLAHAEIAKKREQEYELDQQNRSVDASTCDDVKKYLMSFKKQNRLSQV